MILPNYTYKGVITNVVDGDTADIDIDVGFHIRMKHRLRFYRINTAEMTSSIASERELALAAKQHTINAVLNKEVVITTFKSDAFGRYLAEVFYMKDGQQINLNDELENLGLARPYK